MKKLSVTIFTVFMFFGSFVFGQPGIENRQIKPGTCYAKCFIADEYITEKEQVELKAASFKVEIIPAQYESVSEQILVKDAATPIERVTPEYETVTQSFVKGCPSGYSPEGGGTPQAGGNCVRMIALPAEYETVTEQVLLKEASTRLQVVPATFENVTEQILVKPASFRTQIVPAEYESMTEQVLVKEASTRIERRPARYETQSEQIETAPAATKWVKKRANRNCLSTDPNDCLVWCLVETPAQYQTIIKKIKMNCAEGWTADRGDCIRNIEVPAEYTTRTYRKLKTSGYRRLPTEVPAEYKTIIKKVIKTPAQRRTIDRPAEYTTTARRVMTTAATTRIETAPVLMGSYRIQVYKGCREGYTESGVAGKNGDCIRTIEIPAEYANRSYLKLVSPASLKTIEVPAEYTTITRRFLVKKGGFTEWREIGCIEKIVNTTVSKLQQALIDRGYDMTQDQSTI